MIKCEVNGQVLEFFVMYEQVKIYVIKFSMTEELNMRHCLNLAHIEWADMQLNLRLAA